MPRKQKETEQQSLLQSMTNVIGSRAWSTAPIIIALAVSLTVILRGSWHSSIMAYDAVAPMQIHGAAGGDGSCVFAREMLVEAHADLEEAEARLASAKESYIQTCFAQAGGALQCEQLFSTFENAKQRRIAAGERYHQMKADTAECF